MRAADRREAGEQLGRLVAASTQLAHRATVIVVGLPRGGVPVAAAVADALGVPLDVVVVRKLGVPGHRELAMGAVGEDGAVVWNDDLVRRLGITDRQRDDAEVRARADLDRVARSWRADRQPIAVAGATVVVVDDGVATGATARVAAQVLRARGAARVILAAPVAPPDWDGRPDFDATIVTDRPAAFVAVGQHYVDFGEVADAEVAELLAAHRRST
jgi:predicted phosphoribosyltransferase